uniref:nitrite reductase small subunit NirD n=1 Tax=Algoriphagus sp. TaxID=1872435 RepID=UPI00258911FD|nr:nitrite reductase small subunit NirD [Algoriphagus sp.]
MTTSQNASPFMEKETIFWFKAAPIHAFPIDSGACIKYLDQQIAVFNFSQSGEWYACQNLCPHRMQMVLARGLLGSCGEEPKVACPFHKKTFSLKDGKNLNGDDCHITTYPTKIEGEYLYIGLPFETSQSEKAENIT